MSGVIFQVGDDGEITAMRPGVPRSEEALQDLIARDPKVLALDDDLLLVQREARIAGNDGGSGRWSVDHLFVTHDAKPVLVEVKRASDTRLRREVVGQMLDYAANGVAYWPAGQMADSFALTCEARGLDPEAVLRAVIGEQDDVDFWERADANFQAGRIKMIFVADAIPTELARVVEFLNDQMRADVQAVELGWYAAENGVIALVPRVVGSSARADAKKRATVTGERGGERLEARRAFWSALIERLRTERTGFEGKPAPDRGDISVGAGVPGTWYKFSVTQSACDVVLYLYRSGDRAWNKRTLASLAENKAAIEREFGGSIMFDTMGSDRAARLMVTLPTGWRNIDASGIEAIANAMVRLQAATQDRLRHLTT